MEVERLKADILILGSGGAGLFAAPHALKAGPEQLYSGTRPATLRRYGETDDKTEEVI
jgi:thioredoxin reductase